MTVNKLSENSNRLRNRRARAPLPFRAAFGILAWIGLIAVTQVSGFSDSRYYYPVLICIFLVPVEFAWEICSSDKRKTQKKILFCACLIGQAFTTSEVAAKENWPHACNAYSNFLEGREVSDTNDCTGIANFILNNASLKPLEFIKLFSNEAEKGKPLSFLLRAQLEVMYERPQKAFDLLDIADRELYAKTLINGDVERANVYALLLRSLKVQAIQAMCDKGSAACGNLVSEPFLEETLGEKVAWSRDTRSHLLLYCLVRTDAYVVPIRTIFNSAPFSNCMKPKGVKN